MTAAGSLSLLGVLAASLGLLALALHLVRRLQGGAPLPGGAPLRVVQRIPTGPRQSLALVQVADRILLVSLADGGARLLTEIEGAAREQLIGGLSPRVAREPRLGHLVPRAGRRRLGLRLPFVGTLAFALALACGAGTASAQTAPPSGAPPRPTAPAAARTSAPAGTSRSAAAPSSAAPAPAPARPVAIGSPAPASPAGAAPASAGGLAVLGPAAPRVDVRVGEGKNALQLSGAVGLVVLIGVLTLLPALFLLMTSFTRILIVLHFLRSALGTQTVPPGQLLVALAVLLTGVVMNPVLQEANRTALQPYLEGRIDQGQAYVQGVKPFREFMLANTHEQDLSLFAELSRAPAGAAPEDLPVATVVSAFVTSELRTAFQMGFVIFLPFVVVDIIVASVLMSLGMFMLPPMMISLPVKLLLFVLADGWTLVVRNLVASYR